MFTRRRFLQSTLRNSTLVSLAPCVPGFLAKTARAATVEPDERILVVVFLDGGNDGINTVVPFRDDGYAKYRNKLRLSTDRLVNVDDSLGLHPALAGFGKLLESGRLAVVQGVSYPNPNLSHFRSGAIWHSARIAEPEQQSYGWIGTALDQARDRTSNAGQSVFVGGGETPLSLRGRRSISLAMRTPSEMLLDPAAARTALPAAKNRETLTDFVGGTLLDAYTSADRMAELTRTKPTGPAYPSSGLARNLQTVAQMIKTGFGARVYYSKQSGYDTHAVQLPYHQTLLRELGDAVLAFLDDLAAAKLGDRVCLMAFSEFGRRVKENASLGTDHGTAGPVFLAGPAVRSSVIGQTPSLVELEKDNLKWSVDFRSVYATLLEDWLGLPAQSVLGGNFDRLPMFA